MSQTNYQRISMVLDKFTNYPFKKTWKLPHTHTRFKKCCYMEWFFFWMSMCLFNVVWDMIANVGALEVLLAAMVLWLKPSNLIFSDKVETIKNIHHYMCRGDFHWLFYTRDEIQRNYWCCFCLLYFAVCPSFTFL